MSTPALSASEVEIVNGLDPLLRPIALRHRDAALRAGLPFVFLSGLRSRTQQAALAGDPTRTTPAAAAGTSKHEIGFAYDLVRQAPSIEAKVGALGEAQGLEWGGHYTPKPDPNHFEAPVTRADLATYRRVQLLGLAMLVGIALAAHDA